MAENHVVSGLAAKRSELAGQILDYQKKIDQMRVAVNHLDATIKLFSPDYDLRGIKPKACRRRNSYFKPGECQRLVLEVFRDVGGSALSSRQIGDQLIERKGLPMSTELSDQMQKNAHAVAKRLEDGGMLKQSNRRGESYAWKLATETTRA
ncbi:hypothetical protein GH865_06825 [Rhodocyclus tenuis]|uniref:hypothetical protein n=1 Tax=Rhodocyclus gracilis TaxID=2929842 RepID=UPI00129892BE|nr:hypothetical protein [Rhodocyclus gracilis]MRD72965.1 hypothetical protein [Rhodocyclus gracilis]